MITIINQKARYKISTYKELKNGSYFIWRDKNKETPQDAHEDGFCIGVKINNKEWFNFDDRTVYDVRRPHNFTDTLFVIEERGFVFEPVFE